MNPWSHKGMGLKQYHFSLGIQWLHHWELVRQVLMQRVHSSTASHAQGPLTGVSNVTRF